MNVHQKLETPALIFFRKELTVNTFAETKPSCGGSWKLYEASIRSGVALLEVTGLP